MDRRSGFSPLNEGLHSASHEPLGSQGTAQRADKAWKKSWVHELAGNVSIVFEMVYFWKSYYQEASERGEEVNSPEAWLWIGGI